MKAAVELVGDDNFLWDTDYPHPDGTFPWGIDAMMQPADRAGEQAQDPVGQRGARLQSQLTPTMAEAI